MFWVQWCLMYLTDGNAFACRQCRWHVVQCRQKAPLANNLARCVKQAEVLLKNLLSWVLQMMCWRGWRAAAVR